MILMQSKCIALAQVQKAGEDVDESHLLRSCDADESLGEFFFSGGHFLTTVVKTFCFLFSWSLC